ncbi:MAG TPA: hypothetical protein PLR90_02660 [Methylophilus sp.]|nr:hypothetical protein [Methylophilus sp.]HQQ32795.1 hypothetical protein [Methylophilus sp.]
MKTLNLAVIVSTAILLASGLAQANDKANTNNQNLSKRPYEQLPDESAYNKGDNWEGSTLVKERSATEGPTEYQKLRINMLGKQPYMEGNKD